MTRRPRRSFLLGLAAAAILATAGVSGGLAASGGTATPERQAGPAETIQQCRATLASLRTHANNLRKLRSDVQAKRTYLYTIGHFGGHPLFVPISVSEFAAFLSEELTLGAITPRQLIKAVQSIKRMTAQNLVALSDYVEAADNHVDRQRSRCNSLGGGPTVTSPKPPPPSATTFTRQPVRPSDVTNTHQSELTIDAAGMSAHFDNSRGGGAVWKVDYSWEVPQTITAGKTYTIMLHDKILSVTPNQPLGDQMNALAPDFAQAIQAHWPESPDVSKTFTVPLAAGQKDSTDIPITIGFVSSGVTYHYRK